MALKKLLKNKKGMSLLEVIIGMMMFTMIASSVIGIMISTLRTHTMANDLAETNSLLDSLSAEILSDLGDAVEAEVSGQRLTITTDTIEIEYDVDSEGFVTRGGVRTLSEQYYKGRTARLEYYNASVDPISLIGYSGSNPIIPAAPVPSKLVVRIILFDRDDNPTASRDYAAMPLGLNPYETY